MSSAATGPHLAPELNGGGFDEAADVYACGVDIVGPSNIFTLLESVPAYWEAGRAFLYGMVGDPETEEGRKRIEEASPLFSADKISKPLLVIQGANDPRVKKAEADQIVVEGEASLILPLLGSDIFALK